MYNTYESSALAKLIVKERLEEQQINRALRTEAARRTAQQRLEREIERILKAEGSVQSVLDVLDHVASNLQPPTQRKAETICCS